MGIVFEEDAVRQRVVVSAFVPGSHVDQLTKAHLRSTTALFLTMRKPVAPMGTDTESPVTKH